MKAKLTIDYEECKNCPLKYKDGDSDDWFRFRCIMDDRQIPKEGRLKGCQLQPIPEEEEYQDGMRLINANELLERLKHGDTTGVIEDDIKLAKTIKAIPGTYIGKELAELDAKIYYSLSLKQNADAAMLMLYKEAIERLVIKYEAFGSVNLDTL